MIILTVNTWPESQKCMQCKHGSFIMGDDPYIGSSAYSCDEDQDVKDCECFEEADDFEEE